MKIFGAGYAGLLAGALFPDAEIFDSGFEVDEKHKALLRFRTDNIGLALGINFKQVKVHKNVLYQGTYYDMPNIKHKNLYSKKVIGQIRERSLERWTNTIRYVAPENFLALLKKKCEGRIHWGVKIDRDEFERYSAEPIISTLPMNYITDKVNFVYRPITVGRAKIKNCNIHQTIYYPESSCSVYRASIVGDILIEEHSEIINGGFPKVEKFSSIWDFGLTECDIVSDSEEIHFQEFGKIVEIDEYWRRKFVYDLTHECNIYSLGRFATWRNIMLDDVFRDIQIIKNMLETDNYGKRRSFYEC